MSAMPGVDDSFWGKEEQVEKAEGSGGSGWFSKIRVQFGFKIFPPAPEEGKPAYTPSDTFFPFNPLDDLAKETANKEAKKKVVDLGLSSKPMYGLALTILVGTIYGREHNFKGDNMQFFPSFGDDYKNIVKPSLKQFNLTGFDKDTGKPVEYWAHTTYKAIEREVEANPKRPYRDSDWADEEHTKLKPKFVLYVDAVYPDEQTMIHASGLSPVNGTPSGDDDTVPPAFTASAWENEIVPDVIKLLKSGRAAFSIASDYGVDIKYIRHIKDANQL